MKFFKTILLMLVIILLSCAENTNPVVLEKNYICIDTVYSFFQGEGQNAGQSSEYYPMNIFGEPSNNASIEYPENSPKQILSLGFDGEITVGFKNYEIIDAEGDDFIIFENVFRNPINGKNFVEPAIVSVSIDGTNYYEFPIDSSTLEGCAGSEPTFWNKKNIRNSGGNKFDLSTISIERINYIRIKDISRMLLNNPNHYYYDLTISGFDLDAVVGINFQRKK